MRALVGFALMGFCIAAIVGWVLNIVNLFNASFDPLTGKVVLQVIGVFFAPLGAILGYVV